MESSIFKKAGEFLAKKSKRRNWQIAVTALGIVVIVSTAYVLSKPAQTLGKETYCGMEEHEHTDECYVRTLICELEENGGAGDSQSAAQPSDGENQDADTSGSADTGADTDASQPSDTEENTDGSEPSDAGQDTNESLPSEDNQSTDAALQSEEAVEAHQHDESCYRTETILVCGESAGHIHGLNCYAGAEELICGLEENGEHVHGENCRRVILLTALSCGLTESEEHTHSSDCYTVAGAKRFTCEEPASEEHTHGDGCYTILNDSDLVCANGGHIHTESCYQTNQVEQLICELEEAEGHTHTDVCYGEVQSEEPLCGQEESGGHTHGDDCYTVTQRQELICGQEESEEHTHTEECYNNIEEKELTCELEETEGHTHTETCFISEEKELICGLEESEGHTHTEACRTIVEEKKLICGMAEGEGAAEHVHNLGCCQTVQTLVCGKEETAPQEPEETQPKTEAQPSESESQPSEAESTESQPETESTQPSEAPEESGEQTEGHVHTDECYAMVLACGMEEHTHVDKCYEKTYCGLTVHVHDQDCMDEEGNVVCGITEHSHTDNCYKEPHCGIAVHVHTQECTDAEGNVICGMTEHVHEDSCYFERRDYYCQSSVHTHGEECLDEEGNIICGYADFVIHIHNEECYDPNMRLLCPLPEIEEHIHTEECWQEGEDGQKTLICEKIEAELHAHSEECRDEEGKLICGKLETLAHQHSEVCYEESAEQPDKIETEVPVQKPVFYCADRIHVHKDTCYDEDGNLVCGEADFVVHTHNEECYDDNMKLICPLTEIEEHIHGAECIGEGSELICEREQIEVHEHSDECYDAAENLICRKTEILRHEHSDECHTEQIVQEPVEKITYYCLENIHRHTEECYDEEGSLICGEADYMVHVHTEECYDAEKNLICPMPELEAHVHSAECYPEGTETEEAQPACGKEEVRLHTHTEECCDENGELICGQPEIVEHVHNAECQVSHKPVSKTYQNARFIVTATYRPDANIPDAAELIAEEITAESDKEHYERRQAEYQEAVGDDKATIRALLKIGFYLNGEEIEPATPVTVTIQFLDENGLEEGKPITVMHFAEEGSELLDGSKVEDGSTTFEMDSFSEVIVGYGAENVKVEVDEDIEYKTDAFDITFHIKGEVSVPLNSLSRESGKAEEDSTVGGDTSALPEENAEDSLDNEQIGKEEFSQEISGFIDNGTLEGKLEFKVDLLGEGTEEYASAAAYADELRDAEDSLLMFDVLSYALTYNGTEVELADCIIEAEIAPTQALVEYVEQPVGIATLEEPLGEEDDETFEISNKVMVVATELTAETQISANSDTMLLEEGVEIVPIVLTMTKNAPGKNTMVVYATSSKVNAHFTVQYYAYLDRVVKGNSGELEIINTEGKNLPTNSKGQNQVITKLTLEGSGKKKTIKSERKATEVYTQRDFEYVKAPNIKYFNALIKNSSYVLTEVWVNQYPISCPIPEGEDHQHSLANGCFDTEVQFADKIQDGQSGWKKYDYSILTCTAEHNHTSACYTLQDVHFTNRKDTADQYKYVLIKEGTILRLVYDPTESSYDNEGMFYDYDISDGYTEKNGIRNMNTQKYGINSDSNYSGTGVKYAFGNKNCGTMYGESLWGVNKLNRGNHDQVYKGCTFGLVSGVDQNDNVIFSNGVIGPPIFGSESAIGKYGYDGKLTFARTGDTYTLTGVRGEGFSTLTELDQFNNPQSGSKDPYYNIWTNNFWPMDSAINGKDTTFGKAQENGTVDGTRKFNDPKFENLSWHDLPVSDDGLAHNSFFGMYYAVEFDLPEDYCGPLEYLFFGDDDMWVFLDDKTLVCDIGGVHSSVGEYVNLWDYLRTVDENGNVHVESGTHTLKFFYTERGASGSTCWMQFTLPSVTSIDPGQNTGALKIEKAVSDKETGNAIEIDDTFHFKINLIYKGTHLWDDYSYTKYNAENVAIDHDVIVWDGAEFTLRNGEYIIVEYLPIGTQFEIEELGSEKGWFYYTQINSDSDEQRTDSETATPKKATGTISTVGSKVEVKYNNLLYIFELPETGGSGANTYTIAGVIVLLGGAGLVYRKKFRERRV